MIINDVTRFSNEQELADAMQGKYAKDYQKDYKLTLIKNVCFINTLRSCTIDNLPDHYAFKYYDTSWHTVTEDTNKISINGVACFFFTIKNT
jgi:hypothetical protein